MLALGCSNFLGSFFKIHVICCALSVTLAVDSAGGTSQVCNLLREVDNHEKQRELNRTLPHTTD